MTLNVLLGAFVMSYRRFCLPAVLFAAVVSKIIAAGSGVALVRHAPVINGTVDGSVQQMTAESATLNGGAEITGNWLVPGTPTVSLNGRPSFGGTTMGTGAASPTNYSITLNGNASLGHLVTRTDSFALPTVAAPPAPIGTRSVTVNKTSDANVDFSGLRDLTLNGNVGQVSVPAGTYGSFTANGNSGFTLGVVGASRPAIYNFQHLTLNGNTALNVVGPVIITLRDDLTANGNIGTTNHPEWLTLRISSGSVTLNGKVSVYGYVVTPQGTVTVNGNSLVAGGVTTDRLVVNGNGTLRLADIPPSISLDGPADGSVLRAPAALIHLQASANDADGVVAKVEFFAGTTKIGESATVPYAIDWANVPAGAYALTAKATDNAGGTASSVAVNIIVDAPPTVVLIQPANNSVVTAPASVTLSANAADADGTVAKVEFFNGTTKLGEANAAPFTFSWQNVSHGRYTLAAVATDDRGFTATSTATTLVVNEPPVVSVTGPSGLLVAPSQVVLSSSATDVDGSIAKVEFFNGTTKLGEVDTPTTAPSIYALTTPFALPGTFVITAVATDNLGATTTSSPTAVFVDAPPTVALMSPTNSAVIFGSQPVNIVANAADADGSVVKVEFFDGAKKLGEVTNAPFQWSAVGLASGSHTLSARATDNSGAVTTSAQIAVTVDALPTVTLSSPTNNAVFTQGATVTISATASDSDGTVAKVEFFDGTTKIGEAAAAPYQSTWSNVTAGTHVLVARATDNLGGTTDSAGITVTVSASAEPPTATGASADVNQGQSATITLQGHDSGGAPLTFQWLNQPQLGSFTTVSSTNDSTTVTYTAGTTAGVDSLQFIVNNGQKQSTPATLSVRVLPTPPAPVGPSGTGGGAVYDAATGKPIDGVLVRVRDETGECLSDNGGGYSATVSNFNGLASKYAYIAYSAPGYITSYRKVVAYAGTVVPIEPVYLKKRDSKVTIIGANGGTATNSTGDVEVDIPAGALSQNVPVQATNYQGVHELPGFLPESSAFTYALDLSPDGTTFNSPVTVKIANVLAFPAGTQIPVGLFNPSTVQWEPECDPGVVSADGQWVVLHITHFSQRDCNTPGVPAAPKADSGDPAAPGKSNTPDSANADQKSRDPGVGIGDGTYETDVSLPSFNILGRAKTLRLVYESEQAAGQKLIDINAFDQVNVASPLAREVKVLVGGHASQATYKGEDRLTFGSFRVDQKLNLADLPTGLYRADIEIANLYPGTYGLTPIFGGSPVSATTVPTRQPVRLSAKAEKWIPWVNRTSSPFGTGWSLAGLDRLYTTPEQSAVMIAGGDGSITRFVERMVAFQNAQSYPTGFRINNLGEANDGGILVAHHNGIVKRNRDGTFSAILDGVDGAGLGGYGEPDPNQGGITGVCQAAAGTVYFTYYTAIEIPGSKLTQTGLYRIEPCSSTPTLISADFDQPTSLVMDRSGMLYVYDRSTSCVWKVDDSGTKSILAQDTGWLDGLYYDAASDRLVLKAFNLVQIYRPDGAQSGTLALPEGANEFLGNTFHDAERHLCLLYWDANYNVRLLRFEADGHPSSSPTAPIQTAGFTGNILATSTGDIAFYDGWNNSILFFAGNTARSLSDVGLVAESDAGVSLAFDSTAQHWRRTDLGGNVAEFDTSGALVSKADRFGNGEQYVYDAAGRLTTITFSPGGTLQLSYDGSGRIASVTDVAGRITRFTVDGTNNLTSVVYPDGNSRFFAYDSRHRIVSKTDPAGHTMTFTLDAQGNYTKITYADGTNTSFSALRVAASAAQDPAVGIGRNPADPSLPATVSAEDPDLVTDQAGAKARYVVDSRGYLQTKVGAAGDAASIIWDSIGRPAARIDGDDNRTEFDYDQRNNVIAMRRLTKAGDPVVAAFFQYDGPFDQVSVSIDPNGNSTQYTYGTNGALQQITDPLGKVTTFETNARGQVTKITDPLGRSQVFANDLAGNLNSVTDGAGGTSTLTRDAAGRVTDIADAIGRHTTYGYDAMNRLTSVTLPDGGSIAIGYDANGNRSSVTNQLGKTTKFTYDSMDRLVKVTAPDNSQTLYSYDSAGRLTGVTDPNGNTVASGYDASGRRTSVTDALGHATTFKLDGNGNIILTTDALSRATQFKFDPLNRVTQQVAPDAGITQFTYDSNGNLLTLVDPNGQTTTWTYDSMNRRLSEADRLNKTRSFTYDDAGQLVTETNRRNQTITRSYDSAGRIAGLNIGTDTVNWVYDLAGELKTATNSVGAVQLAYDTVGRLASSTQPAGALSYVYDVAGNRVQMVDPIGTTAYHYDPLNRLTKLTDANGGDFVFGYDAGSRPSTVAYPNGVVAAYTFDAANQLLSLAHKVGTTTVASTAYTYDSVGNRLTDTRDDGTLRTFSFDPNDRVLSAQSSNAASVLSEAFGYDKLGNWTTDSRVHNAANELVEDSSYTYTYDDDGNLIQKQSKANAADVTTYTWDALNRLTNVHTPTAQVDYAYDALGRRASRTQTDVLTNQSKITRFVYDGENVRVEVDGSGTVLAANTHAGLDRMLARTDFGAGARYFLHGDALDSTLALTDSSGSVVERYRYSTFGLIHVLSPEFATRTTEPLVTYTYSGRDWDSAANLFNYRARAYSPMLGRFISSDPIGLPAGINVYAYCANNPILNIDPFGTEHVQEPGFTKPLSQAGNMVGTLVDVGAFSPRMYINSYRDAGLLPTGTRPEGAYTMVVGASATVGGVIALTPAGETASGGTSTVLGVTGVVTGIPTFWAGFVQLVSGKEVPKSPGDVVAIATKNEEAGKMVDLSMLLLDPESLAKKPKNFIELTAQADAAKTGYDSLYKLVDDIKHEDSSKR